MNDKFYPLNITRLLQLYLNQIEFSTSFLGIPKAIFSEKYNNKFESHIFNQTLEFPLGVAAGPHTQLSHNIVSAWLCGARYIELKTIQTLDEIEVQKPCIDMQDEGYNCEWSQELKIKESFNQYLDAWIMIHIINHLRGEKQLKGTIFNMSVGYNLEGILNENVQWFLNKMTNCKPELQQKIEELKPIYPQIDLIEIPTQISNNITLSTMHGCPPDEIEKIAHYLISKRKLHTMVKLNPTLLGPAELRKILNKVGKFDTDVPNEAFKHDLKYKDAVRIIKILKQKAEISNVQFGLKLTNTLESLNNKHVFNETVKTMYMSGRALHPISVALANKLQHDFNGELLISFAGGADTFNFPNLIAAGLSPVTVCSDILKPGGYARLAQYKYQLDIEFELVGAKTISEFVEKYNHEIGNKPNTILLNLKKYEKTAIHGTRYQKTNFVPLSVKGKRKLDYFDCIAAPCMENCAANQEIPDYLYYTAKNKFKNAIETILKTNALPAITGYICDHLCQLRCTRINFDDPLLIREIKRFVDEKSNLSTRVKTTASHGKRVAIIGAGPSGLSCAYYLCLAGFKVDIFESSLKGGGMVSHAIPTFRLSNITINKDIERVKQLGANFIYNKCIDNQLFDKLHREYDFMYIATGAPLSMHLNIPGTDAQGIIEPLEFLFNARMGKQQLLDKKVAVIGGGNTAMDVARVAHRLVGKKGLVTIIYRRTKREMPADMGEIKAVIEEGITILEKVIPESVVTKHNKVTGLNCVRVNLVNNENYVRLNPVKIADSAFFMNFDIVIPAIGQSSNINFIGEELYKPHPNTHEILLKGVYTGGDAMRGAATAIKAIADGRKAAEEIIVKAGFAIKHNSPHVKQYSYNDLMLKRSRRELGATPKQLDLNERKSFKPISYTLTTNEAIQEAGRCLQCDLLCNICVTVCPNRANYSFEIEPITYKMFKAVKTDNGVSWENDKAFRITQKYQVINIADFCNECGNCTTFCPTSGSPYKDKPKFYLTIKSFNDSDTGYFLSKLPGRQILIYKEPGGIRTLEKTEINWWYETDHVKVGFELADFKPHSIEFKVPCAQQAHFQVAAEMTVLYHAAQYLY